MGGQILNAGGHNMTSQVGKLVKKEHLMTTPSLSQSKTLGPKTLKNVAKNLGGVSNSVVMGPNDPNLKQNVASEIYSGKQNWK